MPFSLFPKVEMLKGCSSYKTSILSMQYHYKWSKNSHIRQKNQISQTEKATAVGFGFKYRDAWFL